MSLPSSPRRRIGVLIFWHLSEHGGFGKIIIPATQELFFIYRKLIVSGEPVPGATVTFTPIPPLEGRLLPRAGDAVIDNSRPVRQVKLRGGAR